MKSDGMKFKFSFLSRTRLWIGRNYCMDEHLSEPVDIAVLERAVRKYLVTPPPKMRDRQPRFTR